MSAIPNDVRGIAHHFYGEYLEIDHLSFEDAIALAIMADRAARTPPTDQRAREEAAEVRSWSSIERIEERDRQRDRDSKTGGA